MKFADQTSFSKKNNFDLMRLCASILVFYVHAYSVLHLDDGHARHLWTASPDRMGLSYGILGVTAFFVMSGFLVTGSFYAKKGNIKDFFVSRMLRIYPALITHYLVVIFIIGALVTALPTLTYILIVPVYIFFDIVFIEFLVIPNTPISNNSLWTLHWEVIMYLILPCILLLQNKYKHTAFIITIIYICILFLVGGFHPMTNPELGSSYALSFLLGSLLYIYQSIIPRNIYLVLGGGGC